LAIQGRTRTRRETSPDLVLISRQVAAWSVKSSRKPMRSRRSRWLIFLEMRCFELLDIADGFAIDEARQAALKLVEGLLMGERRLAGMLKRLGCLTVGAVEEFLDRGDACLFRFGLLSEPDKLVDRAGSVPLGKFLDLGGRFVQRSL